MTAYFKSKEEARAEQQIRAGEWRKKYEDHLNSPEWKRTRSRVLHRCNGKCEGCGVRIPIHVHHLTYQHMGQEYLFELVGLCYHCHTRLHSNGNGN